MKELKEMMAKKDKENDPMKKEAKLKALKALKKMASDMESDDIKGIRKVTVAAPDKEGLEKGLEKAKEIVENPMEMAEESMDEDMEMEESEDMEEEGAEDLSSIEEQIKKLQAKKEQLLKK